MPLPPKSAFLRHNISVGRHNIAEKSAESHIHTTKVHINPEYSHSITKAISKPTVALTVMISNTTPEFKMFNQEGNIFCGQNKLSSDASMLNCNLSTNLLSLHLLWNFRVCKKWQDEKQGILGK